MLISFSGDPPQKLHKILTDELTFLIVWTFQMFNEFRKLPVADKCWLFVATHPSVPPEGVNYHNQIVHWRMESRQVEPFAETFPPHISRKNGRQVGGRPPPPPSCQLVTMGCIRDPSWDCLAISVLARESITIRYNSFKLGIIQEWVWILRVHKGNTTCNKNVLCLS